MKRLSPVALANQSQFLMTFEMRDKRYRCSIARIEALDRLQELKRGALAASRKSIPANVKDMTYQSAIFQASATLEDYIKQIFDHWIFELKNNSHNGDSIPQRARFSYFARELSQAFGKYTYEGDEKALTEKILEKSRLIEFAMGQSLVLPHLTGEFAYKNRKYPSPANIKRLYARIGCDDVFSQLSRNMQSNAELKLQAFNDIRTAIAHGSPPNLTLIDVKRNLEDVSLIIKSLDKINHKEFSSCFGGGVW